MMARSSTPAAAGHGSHGGLAGWIAGDRDLMRTVFEAFAAAAHPRGIPTSRPNSSHNHYYPMTLSATVASVKVLQIILAGTGLDVCA
jgi:hypothetical protein